VRHGAVAAQVAIPPVRRLVELQLVELLVEPLLALRAADDLAETTDRADCREEEHPGSGPLREVTIAGAW
jgi:hypothetical protein